MTTPDILPPPLRAAAEQLGAALDGSEATATLRRATTALDGDEQATRLLRRLEEEEAEVWRRRAAGNLRRYDIERILATRDEVGSPPIIAAYAEAEEAAVGYLPEVNALISNLVGCDFAAMAAARGTC